MPNRSAPVAESACCASADARSPVAACRAALGTGELPAADAAELAGAFKALGDPVRLQLLCLIAARAGEEVCVCELTPRFDLTGPTISHHLKVLRTAGLIDCQRRGTWVYYWIRPTALTRLADFLTVDTAPAGSA